MKSDFWLFCNWQNYVVSDIAKRFGISKEMVRERIALYGFRVEVDDKVLGAVSEFVYKCLNLYGYTNENVVALGLVLFPGLTGRNVNLRVRSSYNGYKRRLALRDGRS